MPTIKDVAKEAGVSVASVSRYMNKKGYVSETTQQRIQKAIDKLAYQPNEIARSLFQKKTNMIGLIIPDISNPFFPMLARGVEDYLIERNYQMVLGNAANDPTREKQYYQMFQQHNFAGIITAMEPRDDFELKLPVIQVDRARAESPFYVRSDHELGGSLVGLAISESTPKKVLVMRGPQDIVNATNRHQSLTQTLTENKIAYSEYQAETFGLESIHQIVKEIFVEIGTEGFDTIAATNDMHAIYLIKEAVSRGIKIPTDLQIIGYDGIDFAELMVPQLTTVSQSVYEMGSLAAEMLLNRIEGTANQSQKVNLPVILSSGETLRKR